MGRTAIVGAMQEELSCLLRHMPDEQRVHHAGRAFWLGHMEGQAVVVVLSRIGKVAAATTTTLLLTLPQFDVQRIVFTGTAGGLRANVEVGDVVVADTLLQHDMDASPLFPRHEVPLYGRDRFQADPGISDALIHAAQQSLAETNLGQGKVHRGLMLSGDRFVCTPKENEALRARLPQSLAVEMEGAALAQVCHDFGVPFGVVRTVSDRADGSAHGDFSEFVKNVASGYSLAIVQRYLRSLP